MSEEINEESLKGLIGKIPEGLSPVERLILFNEGTVQTFLSVLFRVPIKVNVISQIDFAHVIIRWSQLIAECPSKDITVCFAESVIRTNASGFMTGIKEKSLGIGQLIAALRLETNRSVLGCYSDNNVFSRTYRLTEVSSVPVCDIIITEVFLKEQFRKVNVV